MDPASSHQLSGLDTPRKVPQDRSMCLGSLAAKMQDCGKHTFMLRSSQCQITLPLWQIERSLSSGIYSQKIANSIALNLQYYVACARSDCQSDSSFAYTEMSHWAKRGIELLKYTIGLIKNGQYLTRRTALFSLLIPNDLRYTVLHYRH